jgi:mono/diheme cytochrome c family protein
MRKATLAFAVMTLTTLAPVSLHAKAPWVKKAQELGFKDIQNCQSCHLAKMPGLNDLGKWLADEKTKKNAPAVDLAWLKDYKKS